MPPANIFASPDRTEREVTMNENLDPGNWTKYFTEFTARNQSRPTRLEVFGETGAQEQERGLAFNGISLDQREGAPRVEIMLGEVGRPRHLTHVISDVRQIKFKLALDGRDEALEIVGGDGETSLLRFEPLALIGD
jgi:hypothetical protein